MAFRVRVFDDRPITDAETSNNAAGRASVLLKITGNLRRLWELATGSGVDGEPPGSGVSPQGLIGVDLSGPPWGPALKHPILTWSCATDAADWDLPALSPNRPILVDNQTTNGPFRISSQTPWVRAHAVDPLGPYSRMYWLFRARMVTAGTATLTFKTTGSTGVEQETDVTFSSTSFATIDPNADGDADSFFTPMKGGDSTFELSIESDLNQDLEIIGYSANQIVKIHH